MSDREFYIKSYCSVKNNQIVYNGKAIFKNAPSDFLAFIKSAYKELLSSYPKFYKMDALSKLATVASSIVLDGSSINLDDEHNIALVFSNSASSLETDRAHQALIDQDQGYGASPSIFVYTLPNICLGELSIKYKLYSENSFFIFEHFNASHLLRYAEMLLLNKQADQVLCGWIEVDGENYNAFVYLVAPTGEIRHSEDEINRLYNH